MNVTESGANECPEPGAYYAVPFSEYRSWEAMNWSTLRHGLRSMRHLRHAIDHPAPEHQTPAMRLGTMIHSAALEPLRFARDYAIIPDIEVPAKKDGTPYQQPKKTKYYQDRLEEFTAQNPGKMLIDAGEFEMLEAVACAIHADPDAMELIGSAGESEVSLVWDDIIYGIRCKCRIDKRATMAKAPRIIDLKTCADASAFPRAIANWGYHRQMAFYSQGYHAIFGAWPTCYLIAIETAEPFSIRTAPLSADALHCGMVDVSQVMHDYAEALQTDQWTSYSNPEAWELPRWYNTGGDDLELTIGGESVKV